MSLLNGFTYHCKIVLPDGQVFNDRFDNLMPQEGVDYFADLFLANVAPINAFYVGIYEGNYTPTMATKATDIPGAIGECTAYSAAGRPQWKGTYDGVSLLSNESNLAEFALTADKTLYGAFITSSSTKAGGGGVLVSIGRFPSPRTLPAGTTFTCWAEIPLVPTDF